MNKHNIIIISTVGIILIIVLVAYFIFGRKSAAPAVSPTPEASDTPIFSPTPESTTDLITGVCPNKWVGQLDSDGDGLPDSMEAIYKTDPANPDSDSDGYKDGNEVQNGYDPMSAGTVRLDSDKDGLLDNEECKWGTDPLNPDTDGDGYKDGDEVKNGYDPLIAGNARIGAAPSTPPALNTPTPGGLTIGTPTPYIFSPTPLTNTNTPAPTPITGTGLTLVSKSELIISKINTVASIKKYLASVDSIKPINLTTGTQFSDAILSAFNGNGDKLRAILTTLKQHEQKILAIPTPEVAVNHQILLASLVRMVNKQLTIIADTAGKDKATQYNTALDLQKKLSANITALNTERGKLNLLAQ